jgi:hypothetical protein
MQDAFVGSWARESHLPQEMLESLRGLNHRFLDLACLRPDGWERSRHGLPLAVSANVTPLSAAQRAAASNCPYALFDLRFHDDCHWQARLREGGRWNVAEAPAVDPETLEFVQLALFFAWHVASTTTLAAQLLLGMQEATATAFRAAAIARLPSLAATEAGHLTARWKDSARYWAALIGAAGRPNSTPNAAELRRIQLYGLQLAAAARLDPGVGAAARLE